MPRADPFTKSILVGLPVFLIAYLFLPNNKNQIQPLPSIHKTSLADSIPLKYYNQLAVNEKQGVRIIEKGKATTYLEYNTDPVKLLRIIGDLPFSKFAYRADTSCIEIGFNNFTASKNSISREESSVGSYFWNIQPQHYQRYECIKGYEKHTLLINRNSDQVLHRIEFTS